MVALFATLSVSLVACGDDDDDAPTNSLVGTWDGVSVDYDDETMTITFHKDGKVELVKYDGGKIDFRSTGSYVTSQSAISFNVETTYTYDGETENEIYMVPFVLANDVLIIGETDNSPFQEDYRFTRKK